MKEPEVTGKNKILDVMKRRGREESSKVDEIAEKLKDSPLTEPLIGESLCEYEGELGKLYYSEIHLHFQGEQTKQTILMKDIQSIKKEGRKKISIRTATGRFNFGPFHRVKRASVYDVVRSICKVEGDTAPVSNSTSEAPSTSRPASKFPVENIPGMKDPILNEIFASPAPGTPAEGTWLDPVAACTAGAGFIEPIGNETYPIGLKAFFALFFSDSATLEKDFHAFDGDFELKFTPWTEDPSKAFFSREKSYSRKTKLYSCKVNQAQRVRWASKNELFFETTTGMTGLPLADTFNVETKWRIVQTDDGKNNFTTNLKVWCDIEFKKERMNLAIKAAKYKIERGAYDGTVDFYKNFFNFARKIFTGEEAEGAGAGENREGGGVGAGATGGVGVGGGLSASAKANAAQVPMYLIISLCLLVLSCFLLSMMLSSVRSETDSLSETLEKLKGENEKRMEGLVKVDAMANEFHEKYVHLTSALMKTANKRWADVLFQTKTLIGEFEKTVRAK